MLNLLTRFRDIVTAILGLVFLSPIMLLVAIWIKQDSPGPVFYKGTRAGKAGNEFQLIKFRTMYETPESYRGPSLTAEGDPRITSVGKWLRDTKLNEIPQLWNVLVGEMSLVGPRPEDVEIVKSWSKNTQKEILSVRPGITSPASVLFRNEEALLTQKRLMKTYFSDIQPTKLRLDELYIRNRSFLMDLDVLAWTFIILLPGLSSYKPPEGRLYGGMIFRLSNYLLNWFFIDFTIAFLSITASGVFWRSLGPIDIGVPQSILVAFEFAVVFTLAGALMGVHAIEWSKASPGDIYILVISTGVSTAIMFVINQFYYYFPYQIILGATFLAFLGFVLTRYRFRLISGLGHRLLRLRGGWAAYGERVLIVGCGDAGIHAGWMLENTRGGKNFGLVGYVDDDFFKFGTRMRGVPVLGGRDAIPKIVKEKDIGIILFAIHNISDSDLQEFLSICRQTNAQIVMIPDIIGQLSAVLKKNGKNGTQPDPNYTNGTGQVAENDSILEIRKHLTDLLKELEKGRLNSGLERITQIQTLFEKLDKK